MNKDNKTLQNSEAQDTAQENAQDNARNTADNSTQSKPQQQEDALAKEKKAKPFDPYAPHKIKWWGWPLLVLLIVGTIYVYQTSHAPAGDSAGALGKVWKAEEVARSEGQVFGTFYHITYQSSADLQSGIDSTLAKVDASLSPFNKHSVITAINNNTDMAADSMFAEVFTLAKSVSEATDGAFDITVAPLVNLWGFGFKNADNVTDERIDSIMQLVGFKKVRMENGMVIKDNEQIMLDCSAIAKGYGVDAVGRYLESRGVKNYMVEIGGEVRLRGTNPKGMLWKIGINSPKDDPSGQNNDIERVLQLTQMSMATSGNYRNFYEKDGKKWAHTIDPRTGHPVQHNILSSTVLAPDCAKADAFATAFMVLGLEKAQEVLRHNNELMAFFIYADENGEMKEWYTESMKALIAE